MLRRPLSPRSTKEKMSQVQDRRKESTWSNATRLHVVARVGHVHQYMREHVHVHGERHDSARQRIVAMAAVGLADRARGGANVATTCGDGPTTADSCC